jgi:hypothetical protein
MSSDASQGLQLNRSLLAGGRKLRQARAAASAGAEAWRKVELP